MAEEFLKVLTGALEALREIKSFIEISCVDGTVGGFVIAMFIVRVVHLPHN